MRFAYIDSHGNEVPIPSVDALALRIELGAIGPETQLYDAQADHWGPASTHEIFHTLSRDAQSGGFVAPPPVGPPPVPPPPTPPAKPKPKAKGPPKAEPLPELGASPPDLGLTLADPPPEPPKKKSAPAPVEASADLPLLDLAPPMTPKPKAAPPAGSHGTGTFDYGDLGAGLQLEEAPHPTPPVSPGLGGMTLEAPLQFGAGGGGLGGGGDLQLEEPMSSFSPDSPPGWMEQQSGSMDFSPAAAAAEAAPAPLAADAPARPKRAAKDRPPTPKFKKRRSLSTPIVLVVLLLALGVGGYVNWPLLQPLIEARLASLSGPEAPVRPAVVMPAIPGEWLPRMRELAEGALADAVAEVDAGTTTPETPLEPDQQWLGGNYLANATQFASIEAFWTGIEQLMVGLRAADWQLFHDKLVARVEAAGVAADTAAMLIERADSGFVAAEASREELYASMDRLVDASLGLHDFLVLNEAEIEYHPATTSTADPILEAVPSSPAIGDQMLEKVDAITDALTVTLGSIDRVTRGRLTAALVTRLGQTGIQ